jgi:N-acyl-D-glutamate deacylase
MKTKQKTTVTNANSSDENTLYDIVLVKGRVIDPETYRDGIFNVGLMGDQIAAVTDQPLQGKEVIDVSGMIVAPGVVDLHSHGQTITANRLQAFDGVTTALELEAGVLPIGEFYDFWAKEGRPINYGASSGWGFGRAVTICPQLAVDGKPEPKVDFMFANFAVPEWAYNTATAPQMEKILAWTEQGLKEGGIGIGVPWGYAPGAGMKELLGLWQLAAKYDRPTYTHIQNLSMLDPDSGTRSMVELMGLAASTGAHTHICHMNSTSLRDIPIIVEVVKKAQSYGLPVTTEAYVYGAGDSGIGAAEFNPDDVEARMGVKFSDFTLVSTMKDFSSKEEFVKVRTEDPSQSVIVHFLREDDDPHDSELLDMSVLYPDAAICTDTMPWVAADGSFYWGTEWPLPAGLNNHPRASGNYCRFFRKWVRERGVLSWMDAIRRTSLIPCQILEDCVPGMKKKGRLQADMDADIIVFDPETVAERADFRQPALTSQGVKHVIVNGTFLIRDAELDTAALPGRAVRAPIVEEAR